MELNGTKCNILSVRQHHFRTLIELARIFRKFIVTETEKFYDEIGDTAISEALAKANGNDETELFDEAKVLERFTTDFCPFSTPVDPTPTFSDKFQQVLQRSNQDLISVIIVKECEMAVEMSNLIRARDWQMEQLAKECESTALEPGKTNGSSYSQHQHYLRQLKEKIRTASGSYAEQIAALADRQKREYRGLIDKLYQTDGDKCPVELVHMISSSMKKSTSVTADISTVKPIPENAAQQKIHTGESFTIYIGAQLKTMHNARLLQCMRLSDACRIIDPVVHSPSSDRSETVGSIELSRRLHMAMSLYRPGLAAAMLLVSPDPMHHAQQRTEFARLCELSTELHFEPLDEQLKTIAKTMRTEANPWRLGKLKRDDSSGMIEQRGQAVGSEGDSSLSVGDVYVTRHSNLATVQVVYHLVADTSLLAEEISSRHPCINGLRNAIRMSAKCGVTTINIPLLLVERMNEKMTAAWCLRRAELVFKCVKGYLMEICSVGASSSVPGGGPGGGALPHYNVQFLLPAEIDATVYAQIVEMFPTIFHLVPSVVVG